jgi:hypothetical protein
MGLLDWFSGKRSEDTQLNVFGGSDDIVNTSEPSRKLANQKLHDEIKSRGGTRQTHAATNRIVTENMTGHGPSELYEGLGIKPDRSLLPTEAKEALTVGDIAAKNQIQQDDAKGHEQIVDSVDKGTKKARKLFPW